METEFADKMMEYLTARRMVSLKNLADKFSVAVEDIILLVIELEASERVRVAMSRCSSDCSSCSSCGEEEVGTPKTTTLSETSIIISLERVA